MRLSDHHLQETRLAWTGFAATSISHTGSLPAHRYRSTATQEPESIANVVKQEMRIYDRLFPLMQPGTYLGHAFIALAGDYFAFLGAVGGEDQT